jgi:hypothetical protein
MEGSPLRAAFKSLIASTVAEIKAQSSTSDPEEGTVTALNDDGTVSIQTSTTVYGTIGIATTDSYLIGAQVLVITGDGKKVAIPR